MDNVDAEKKLLMDLLMYAKEMQSKGMLSEPEMSDMSKMYGVGPVDKKGTGGLESDLAKLKGNPMPSMMEPESAQSFKREMAKPAKKEKK